MQSSGIWSPTVSNTRFAPTRSCGKTGVIDTAGNGGFKYARNWNATTNSMDNVNLVDTIDTNLLLDKGSESTYKDKVKRLLGWTSTNLVP